LRLSRKKHDTLSCDYVNYHHQKNTFLLFLIYEIKSKILCGQVQSQKVVHHDYTTFVDLQLFIVENKENLSFCEENGGVEKRSYFFSLYFYVSCHGTS